MRLQYLLPLFLLAISVNFGESSCSKRKSARLVNINPPTLFDPVPLGYTQITVDTKNAVAYIAGQVALNQTAGLVGNTLAEQLVEVERNLNLALDAVKADIDDIMKLNAFVLNFNPNTDLETFMATGRRLGSPVSTLVSVPALALEGILVEVEITAAVKESFARKLRCR